MELVGFLGVGPGSQMLDPVEILVFGGRPGIPDAGASRIIHHSSFSIRRSSYIIIDIALRRGVVKKIIVNAISMASAQVSGRLVPVGDVVGDVFRSV